MVWLLVFGCSMGEYVTLVTMDAHNYFEVCLLHTLNINIYEDYFEEEPIMIVLLIVVL